MLDVNIYHDFGKTRLDIAFSAQSSGVTAFYGQSGSGKTSLVNMLAGLLRPDEGRISLDGQVLFDAKKNIHLPPEARRLGYVFQEARLFPHLSVRGNLQYGAKLNPPSDNPRLGFDHVVDLLGIGPLLDRRPHRLSGGERQRVAIGRALLANPRLLLMDEPLAALDAARKSEILPFLERLRDERTIPIVYVSHSVEEIIRLADTVVAFQAGRIVASGAVEEVMSRSDVQESGALGDRGAVLATRVASHDAAFHVTTLTFANAAMQVPLLDGVLVGERVRLRVRARDVALALTPPVGISVLNVLPGTITAINEQEGHGRDILLNVGAPLWARISERAYHDLDLKIGQSVHAMIKAVSIDRGNVARGGAGGSIGGGVAEAALLQDNPAN